MPETCPAWIPAPVWESYLAARDAPRFAAPEAIARAERLLGLRHAANDERSTTDGPPDIAAAWYELLPQITDARAWRRVFWIFFSLPETYNPDAWQARKAAGKLAGAIHNHARALSDALAELTELADHHGLELPPPARELSAWLAAGEQTIRARPELPPRWFECEPALITDEPTGFRVHRLNKRLDPAGLLLTLADAFSDYQPRAWNPENSYADLGTNTAITPIVRHLAAKLARLQTTGTAPPQLTNKALALLLAAVFPDHPRDFTEQAVAYARRPQLE